MTAPAVIHVVDDDAAMRSALERLLQAAGYGVRTYASAGEFLLEPPEGGAACVLLDLRMPGPSGLDLHEALTRRGIRVPVIFLTGHGDVATGVRAMKAGASDFLTKPVARDTLLAAIAGALEAGARQSAACAEVAELRARYARLTARERQVFGLIVAGKLNKQIAGELGVAERTVKAQRAQVMVKLGAAHAAELGRIAARLNDASG